MFPASVQLAAVVASHTSASYLWCDWHIMLVKPATVELRIEPGNSPG